MFWIQILKSTKNSEKHFSHFVGIDQKKAVKGKHTIHS